MRIRLYRWLSDWFHKLAHKHGLNPKDCLTCRAVDPDFGPPDEP